MKAGRQLICGVLAALVLAPPLAFGQEVPAAGRQAIPFKTEPSPVEEYGGRLLLALAVLAGLSVGALYVVKKRLPTWPAMTTGGKRLKVVERVRLNPRCTLYVVRLDGREILIGQCGDTLVQLDALVPIPEEGK